MDVFVDSYGRDSPGASFGDSAKATGADEFVDD
jgi:hypothetical protein